MPAEPLNDFSRLCVHTITTKPWSIEEATDRYAAAGVKGISVWRQWLEGKDVARCGETARAAGLQIAAVVRGGFFPAVDRAGRQAAVDDNFKAIDEAAALGASMVVLVCGAVPGQPLDESRKQILDGKFVLVNGRRYKMKSYAETVARTRLREAQTKATKLLCEEYENDLVKFSNHDDPCPECEKYEGKIYSLSGTHPDYEQLTDDISPPVHPRCEHNLNPTSEEAIAWGANQ